MARSEQEDTVLVDLKIHLRNLITDWHSESAQEYLRHEWDYARVLEDCANRLEEVVNGAL